MKIIRNIACFRANGPTVHLGFQENCWPVGPA
jgi:hypothetical protein